MDRRSLERIVEKIGAARLDPETRSILYDLTLAVAQVNEEKKRDA